jgi:hypothetical protein
MTIEAGPKPNGVRTATADTRNQRNKYATTDSPSGGFGAILASMDSSETVAQPVVDAVDANAGAKLAAVSTTSTTTRGNSSVNGLLEPDATMAREMRNGLDASALTEPDVSTEFGQVKKLLPEDPFYALADATLPIIDATVVLTPPLVDPAATVALPVIDAIAASTPAALDAMGLVALASQWSSSNMQNSKSEGKNFFESAAQLALGSVNPVHTEVRPEGVTAVPFALDKPLETPGMSGKLLRDITAKQLQVGDVLTSKEPPAGREFESHSLQLAAKSFEQTTVPLAVTLAVTSSVIPSRREDQTRDRVVFRSNATEGSAFGQSFLSPGASIAVQYTPEVQMSPEVYVAEKVAYWISNDVQNAEMKLDGIGLDPVEVSIRMHGNEAHVAFRTDELQARAALENASAHLKELLQREGLVLTGVSVGTSGAGDSGGSGGKSRQGSRQTSISVASEAAARGGPLAGRAAGGRLDLFV